MAWSIVMHPEVAAWLTTLDSKSFEHVTAAVDRLSKEGPSLRRPLADTLTDTDLKNLKELRPGSSKRSEIRILFAFDPIRQAILLVAGDKDGEWNRWYKAHDPDRGATFRRAHCSASEGRQGMTDSTWEPVQWEDVRAGAVERGQITEEGVSDARAAQDAYVVGYRLAELRDHTGMTQTQVAKMMGVSQARVSAMERGDLGTLTVASVRSYVDALGGTVRIVASLDDTDVTLHLPVRATDEHPPVQTRATA